MPCAVELFNQHATQSTLPSAQSVLIVCLYMMGCDPYLAGGKPHQFITEFQNFTISLHGKLPLFIPRTDVKYEFLWMCESQFIQKTMTFDGSEQGWTIYQPVPPQRQDARACVVAFTQNVLRSSQRDLSLKGSIFISTLRTRKPTRYDSANQTTRQPKGKSYCQLPKQTCPTTPFSLLIQRRSLYISGYN